MVEHCHSWINHFYPCLGLCSVPRTVCACVCSNSAPPHKRLTAKIWYCQIEKALLSESCGVWLRSMECWILSPCGKDASFPVLPWAVQPTSGKHKILEFLFIYFLLCSWHIWICWIFNSYLKTYFCWIFAFSPFGVLLVIPLNKGILYTFLWNSISVLCLTSVLHYHLWHSLPLIKTHLTKFTSL